MMRAPLFNGGRFFAATVLATALVAVAVSGCRQIAGLDENYVEQTAQSGSTGGASTTSTSSTGGAGPTTSGMGGTLPIENCLNCASNKFCDPSQGCVDCIVDTDCSNGNAGCVDGLCKPCRTAEHCAPGQVCHGDNQCGQPCIGAGTCALGTLCALDKQICVQCLSMNECGTLYCHPTLSKCVTCIDDFQCFPGTSRCRLSDHQCVQCLVNSDCGDPNLACNGSTCQPL